MPATFSDPYPSPSPMFAASVHNCGATRPVHPNCVGKFAAAAALLLPPNNNQYNNIQSNIIQLRSDPP